MSRSQPGLMRDQAQACEQLGSQMYAELLRALADDLQSGGPTATVLRGHEDDPGPSGLALRLAGSIHRLVLSGAAPELSAYYPTTGGTWSSDGVGAVLALLEQRADEIRPLLEQAPQTNEVGRATALLGGLMLVARRWRLPVRLFELGASGGLNLQADRFRCTDDVGRHWGDPKSPVLLDHGWVGESLPLNGRLQVVERGGCDPSPVDVTTDDGRLTLTSYVWPDMTARHERLAGAIELARQSPVTLRRADAASYVEALELALGHVTVVWHSVMWQYLDRVEQDYVVNRLEQLGATATGQSPFVHLFAEPTRRTPGDQHRFWVVMQTWPGTGERQFLGRMAPHGIPVVWDQMPPW